MTTIEKAVNLVLKHLAGAKTPIGSEFNLPDLFGDDWNEDYLGEAVTTFGKIFKEAVLSPDGVPGVEFVDRNTANLNIYRRVE